MNTAISDIDDPGMGIKSRLLMLALGPILAALLALLPAPEGMNLKAWAVCALAIWMVVWWVTEAMPLAVTSLLPLVVLPALNVVPLAQVGASFGNPIIFLFMGGFILSAAMQKWHLHTRLAYSVLSRTCYSASTVLAGLMGVACFLAMWMSNTATIILMLPIAMSIATVIGAQGHAPKAIALGVAYAAAIGGLSTFIGTPTNALLYGHMQTRYGVELNLGEWMLFGVPATLMIAGFAWLYLSRSYLRDMVLAEGLKQQLAHKIAELGPMKTGEKRTALVFVVTVLLWLFGGFIQEATGLILEDAAIAIFAALALFLLPTNVARGEFTLEWKDAERIPWGVLVFFGGSLALSGAFTSTGASEWLGTQLEALHGVPPVLMIVVVVAIIIAASEMMSNVATISVFLPILTVLAEALQVNPLMFLLPATMAASCGFMLPGASAANALAYATGHIRVPEMVRAGFWVDIASLLVITLVTFTLAEWAMGMDFAVMPAWASK